MRIAIRGRSDHADHEKMRLATRFFLRKLLRNNTTDINQVTIDFVDGLLKEEKTEGQFLFPSRQDCKSFIIEVDGSLRENRTLMVLAHECVHLKQWHKGELRDSSYPPHYSDSYVKWRGKRARWRDFDENEEHYFDQPWEIEAYGRQVGLYHVFKRFYKNMLRDQAVKSARSGRAKKKAR